MHAVVKQKKDRATKKNPGAKSSKGRRGLEHSLVREPSGWMTGFDSFNGADDIDPLVRHADWLGPTKLVGNGRNVTRLTEVFVSGQLLGDRMFDSEASKEYQMLLAALDADVFDTDMFDADVFSGGGGSVGRPPARGAQWLAPGSDKLLRWLGEVGFQPAVDEQGNLRVTLKARGCDGQVHLRTSDGRMRMSMRLGSWSDLDPQAEAAMLRLARSANDRGRLARIAWIVEGKTRRCEAQVDFSGLPHAGAAERMWPGMLSMAMHGLELALCRLGMELDVLSDPANKNLAADFVGSNPESVDAVSAERT